LTIKDYALCSRKATNSFIVAIEKERWRCEERRKRRWKIRMRYGMRRRRRG
jgi:hypothetical protein